MSQQSHSKHLKLLMVLLLVFIVIPVTVIYFGVINHSSRIDPKDIKIDGAYLTPPKDIIDFHLTDNNGFPFSKENLKGHWTLLFFGFSNCAKVCPTTMSALAKMYQTLQRELPDKKLPQIVMVTVDPERDTVAKMASYVHTFHPHFIGLSGKLSETEALEKQLHIIAIKIQGETKAKKDYYYDHSAELLLVNPDAKVQAYLSYPHNPENLVKEYKLIQSIS